MTPSVARVRRIEPVAVGPHQGTASHAWIRKYDGRYRTVCGYVEEAWTLPTEDERREVDCLHCKRLLNRDPGDPGEAVRKKLAAIWPRGLGTTKLKKVHWRLRGFEFDQIIEWLRENGWLYYRESDAGRRIYVASRKTVEESGRRYGM